ncbi:uncharacterized protein FMAN_14140 [Fusarium mangiferae]|uniref:Zn(2)-C6 fungal-type domain-containing protein n=1 Tax=Fusarium mangiferae TaxID=192010 RepID=A0A1L7UKC4_FUSMA|nr:uncharacterized protein FMAN_14140 [Fusarium mangiferae]CVL08237.1 uncharacterized protein FMAN_14140 [Fusarium mangiferae]
MSEPSATSKDTPFSEGISFSQIPGRSGSELAESQSFLFTPTFPGRINPSLHGSTENTLLSEADAHCRLVRMAIPPTTHPLVYYQQSHPAASIALASPAAQVPVRKLSKKRPRLPQDPISGSNGPASAKRKYTRVFQACKECRQRKVKCDETIPCQSCKEKGVGCIYDDPAPKRNTNTHADCLAHIKRLEKRMDELEACLKDFATPEPKPELSMEDKDGRPPVWLVTANHPCTDPANFGSKATPVLERRPSSASW